jgi:hypothetical protein
MSAANIQGSPEFKKIGPQRQAGNSVSTVEMARKPIGRKAAYATTKAAAGGTALRDLRPNTKKRASFKKIPMATSTLPPSPKEQG